MSIVSVKERPQLAGKETAQGREYKREFKVVFNDASDGPFQVFEHSDIPNPFDEHNVDSSCECTLIDPKPMNDRLNWLVICTYKTKSGSGGYREPPEDPTQAPAQISFGFAPEQKAVDKAYDDGDAADDPTLDVLNSANQPFDPPISQEEFNMLIQIKRNERNFDPNEAKQYKNTLNEKQLVIASVSIGAREGRMRQFGGDKAWDSVGREYWAVKYQIEVNEKTHIKKILDQGFYQLTGSPPNYVEILDSEGASKNEPSRLAGDGLVLAPDTVGGVYLDFRTFFELDWQKLGLPKEHSQLTLRQSSG